MMVSWRCRDVLCRKRDTHPPLRAGQREPVCSRCRGSTEPMGVLMVEGFFERTVPAKDWSAPCPDCAGLGYRNPDKECFACLGVGELPVVRLLSMGAFCERA